MANQPHAPCACPRLRGAFSASRCGAKRRDGGSCQQPAMSNGRCRLHGGLSTGPRTEAGLAASRKARWQHGHYSAEAKAERRQAYAERAETIALVRYLKSLGPDQLEGLCLADVL